MTMETWLLDGRVRRMSKEEFDYTLKDRRLFDLMYDRMNKRIQEDNRVSDPIVTVVFNELFTILSKSDNWKCLLFDFDYLLELEMLEYAKEEKYHKASFLKRLKKILNDEY